MAQKKSSTTGFRKQLLAELQSNVRGGLKRVSGNEILLTPLMDVYETGKEYVLVFAVPGMAKEDVDVRIVGNELIVEEKKGIAKKAYGETVIKELENGRYCRKIQLTAEIDEKSINGTIDKGVLAITLKKAVVAPDDAGDPDGEEDEAGVKGSKAEQVEADVDGEDDEKKGKAKGKVKGKK